MKKIMLMFLICLNVLVFGIKVDSDWSGMWMVQFYSVSTGGWISHEFEMNIDGIINVDGEEAGRWVVEELKSKKFTLALRVLRITANFGEFFILYNYPMSQHAGYGFFLEQYQVPAISACDMKLKYKFY